MSFCLVFRVFDRVLGEVASAACRIGSHSLFCERELLEGRRRWISDNMVYGMVWCGMVLLSGMVWCGSLICLCGFVWCNIIWCGMEAVAL